MADLTAFSNKSFNSAVWINAALKDIPEDESLEVYISSLSTKLHIMSQDYTDQLETAMVESMSTMPRILSEISKTEDQLRTIEAEMKSLSQQLNSFDQRNVAGVEDLSRLDTLKSNMEKCKATLEEHARWSQLVREAKNIMEGGGRLSDSADRIETMFRSLDILKNLPGNLEREETCETFKNSLLSALRPIVRRDVAGIDIAPLQEYLYVFQKLGREFELQEEYVRARPDRIKPLWEEYSPNKHPEFPKWLASFLGKVARLVADEEASTTALFGPEQSPAVLCDILIEALKPMTASLGSRLSSLRSPEASFDAYCVMEEFACRMLVFIQRTDEAKQVLALKAMYAGFTPFLSMYAECEMGSVRAQFVALLDGITFSTRESSAAASQQAKDKNTPSKAKKMAAPAAGSLDDELFGAEGDTADAYGVYGEKILLAAEQFHVPVEVSLRRAVRFAGGVQIKQIVRSLAATLTLMMKHLVLKVDDLGVASGFPRDGAITLQSGGLYNENVNLDGDVVNIAAAEKLSQQQAVADRFAQQLELSDVDSRVLITSALRTLQAIGRVSKNFLTIESTTKALLTELQQSIFSGTFGGTSASLSTLNQASAAGTSFSVGNVFTAQMLLQDMDALSELKSFLVAGTSSTSQLTQSSYASVGAALRKLRNAAGQLLFSLCLEAPEKMLSCFAQEEVWTSSSSAGSTMDLLREHMLPQSVVTQVGEHLLSLVQELEAFAASDALPDLLRVRGETRTLSALSSGWQALKAALEIADDDTLDGLVVKVKCAPLIGTIETTLLGSAAAAEALAERAEYAAEEDDGTSDLALTGALPGETPTEEQLDNAAVLRFVNEWLSAVADATVGLLLSQVATVSVLTAAGRSQLLTDLEYLSNVINATGIRPHPLLAHVRVILQQEPADLVKAIELLPAKSKGPVGYLLKLDSTIIHAIAKGAV